MYGVVFPHISVQLVSEPKVFSDQKVYKIQAVLQNTAV